MISHANDRHLLCILDVIIVNGRCSLVLPRAFKLASQGAEEAVEHTQGE
jgi:hypothetical protein